VPVFITDYGKELSSRQLRSIEDQLFIASQILSDQKQRHFVLKIVDNNKPVHVITPFLEESIADEKMALAYRQKKLLEWSKEHKFVIDKSTAQKALEANQKYIVENFADDIFKKFTDEPPSSSGKI